MKKYLKIEAEENVIAELMKTSDLFYEVSGLVQAEMFDNPITKASFAAVSDLIKLNERVSLFSISKKVVASKSTTYTAQQVTEYLKGLAFKQTQNTCTPCANAVRTQYYSNLLITKLTEVSMSLNSEDINLNAAVIESQKVIDLITNNSIQADVRAEKFQQARDAIQASLKSKNGITGIDTGFSEFNKYFGGWQKTDLVILAARPGAGKTTLSLKINYEIFKRQIPTLFFSLEMGGEQLITKLAGIETQINTSKIRTGGIDFNEAEKLDTAITSIENCPFYFEDMTNDLNKIRQKANYHKAKHGIELIIIDYLQLAKTDKKTEYDTVTEISGALKQLAKKLEVPVICLSQLSRSVETRGGSKRPMLSDLRSSGAIEQDADIIKFIYRPSYYGIIEDEEGNDITNLVEIIVAKNRHGELGTIELEFKEPFVDFKEMNQNSFDDFAENPEVANFGNGVPAWNKVAPVPMNDDEDIPF